MKGMKGVELPINILVIVAVAVVVLLGIVALYFVGWSPFPATVGLESAKNEGCRQLVQERRCGTDTWNIEIDNFDADQDGAVGSQDTGIVVGPCRGTVGQAEDTLFMLCYCHYAMDQIGPPALTTDQVNARCKELCGCL